MTPIKIAILSKSIVFSKGLTFFITHIYDDIIIDEFDDEKFFINNTEKGFYDIVFADERYLKVLSDNDIILRSRLYTNYYAICLDDKEIHQNSVFSDSIKRDISQIELKNKLKEILNDLLEDRDEDKADTTLSKREINILRHIAIGYTNKEIAEKLFLSPHTVMTHRKNITRKLDIKTISGLTVYALLNKVITMEEVKK